MPHALCTRESPWLRTRPKRPTPALRLIWPPSQIKVAARIARRIGFGSYHYKYESGREGDSCLLGFASRKGDISIYGLAPFPGREELLSRLGRHKMGKGCLYISKMSDIDLMVLEQLLKESVAESKKRHG